ncbi:hypothetical protein COL93_03645 [Bacillus toyonensis]|nr:hypothetical protein COL93_03645 [Bacillus toyonensis]
MFRHPSCFALHLIQSVQNEHIEYIVQSMNVEAVICNKKTMIDWYF